MTCRHAITLLLCAALAACTAGRSERIADTHGHELKVTGTLSHAMIVNKVQGAPNWLLRPSTAISDSDFKESLEKALANKEMLAQGTMPQYAIDASINFDETGAAWEGIRVDSEIHYVITQLPDNTIVFDQIVRTQSNKPPLNDGNMWKTLFLTSPHTVIETASQAYETAARTNIAEFFSRIGVPVPAQ